MLIVTISMDSLSLSLSSQCRLTPPSAATPIYCKVSIFLMEINGECDEIWGSRQGGEMKEIERKENGQSETQKERWDVESQRRRKWGGERGRRGRDKNGSDNWEKYGERWRVRHRKVESKSASVMDIDGECDKLWSGDREREWLRETGV